MDLQNVSNLVISEGNVRTIHDKDNNLLWGKLNYDTKYKGNSSQNGEPTPDIPVNINAVTGTQTITLSDGINSYDYIVNLGTIELTKIGTYQDYIYKSGEDWYVHKEINKIVFDGTETTWGTAVSSNVRFFRYDTTDGAENSEHLVKIISDRFIGRYDTVSNSIVISGSVAGRILIFINGIAQSVAQWKAWLADNNVTCYYAIATPTNTKITDSTLISQLDAIHQFLTRYGYNSIVSGNLPLIISKTNL